MIDRLRSDLRIALRSLARSPSLAFTTTAILASKASPAVARMA
jgi:hypothetical protein